MYMLLQFQYAYVNLEHLKDVIKKYRRLTGEPETTIDNEKESPTTQFDESDSTDIDDDASEAKVNIKDEPSFLDTMVITCLINILEDLDLPVRLICKRTCTNSKRFPGFYNE